MQHKHKNTITQKKQNKQKIRFSCLLQHLAWNQSRPILEGNKKKKKKKANRKGK